MIEVERVPWSTLWGEAEPLMREHWLEVRENRAGLEFKVDVETAQQIYVAGMMDCFMAWNDLGELVGYLIWFITSNIESSGNFVATLGPFFVLPEFKGAGRKLWAAGMRELRRRGVSVAHVHVSAWGPRQQEVRRFFESVGAVPYETKYEILVGGSGDV